MAGFDGEPLKVVAKRTSAAAKDLAEWRVTEIDQDKIVRSLKAVPRSRDDLISGEIRYREIIPGFEVAFILATCTDEFVILVIGYDRKGEMESRISQLQRTLVEALHPSISTLIKGRERQDGLR